MHNASRGTAAAIFGVAVPLFFFLWVAWHALDAQAQVASEEAEATVVNHDLSTLPSEQMTGTDRTWMVRLARMEGAAVDAKSSAAALRKTAETIVDEGRLSRLVRLRANATELNRRVVSAQLAAEVLAEPL